MLDSAYPRKFFSHDGQGFETISKKTGMNGLTMIPSALYISHKKNWATWCGADGGRGALLV
eukprot:SAG22_NODE_287_length_12963_cov_21.279086_12_plen_61_part_00